jgi:hypothetical protein
MPKSVRSLGAINGDSVDPTPAFVPFAEDPNWSDKFGDMGELAGLLKGSVVLGNNGDRPDFALLLPLAHQLARATTLSSLNVVTSRSRNTSLP